MLAPLLFSAYTVDQLLTQVLIFGIVAMSLIFLASYGGMVSLAQTALFGIAGFVFGNMTTVDTKGLDARLQPVGRHHPGDPDRDRRSASSTAGSPARSTGIYFLMITLTYSVIANLSFGQIEQISGFGGISGIVPPVDHRHDRPAPAPPLLPRARDRAAALRCSSATSYARPSALSLQGVRDEPVRMSSLGYGVALHRTLAFTFGAFMASIAGVLFVWWNGHVDPQTIGLGATLNVLIIAVIGGLRRIEGAFVGALAFVFINDRLAETDFSVGRLQAGHVQLADRPDLPRDRARLARRPARPLGARDGAASKQRAAAPPRPPPATNSASPLDVQICQASCPPTQRRTRT